MAVSLGSCMCLLVGSSTSSRKSALLAWFLLSGGGGGGGGVKGKELLCAGSFYIIILLIYLVVCFQKLSEKQYQYRHSVWLLMITVIHFILFWPIRSKTFCCQFLFKKTMKTSLILSWKLVLAWWRILKQSGEHKLWHWLESFECLSTWEASSVAKCSRSRVEKMLGGFADVTGITAHIKKMYTTQERSSLGIGSLMPNILPILKDEKTINRKLLAQEYRWCTIWLFISVKSQRRFLGVTYALIQTP